MTIKPRALNQLSQIATEERLDMLAEGARLVGEHVSTLAAETATLYSQGATRAATVLDRIASEEAAKALILLDLARTSRSDAQAIKRLTGAFYQHLARGIYVLVHSGSPQDFKEIMEYVDVLRKTHYLDGRTGADTIYRNMVDSIREESIYVDLVQQDGGRLTWVSPAQDTFGTSMQHPFTGMVVTMYRIGLLSNNGFRLVRDAWEGVLMDGTTRYDVASRKNQEVVAQLLNFNGRPSDVSDHDLHWLIASWTFSLASLDLSPLSVTEADLRKVQRAYYGEQDSN